MVFGKSLWFSPNLKKNTGVGQNVFSREKPGSIAQFADLLCTVIYNRHVLVKPLQCCMGIYMHIYTHAFCKIFKTSKKHIYTHAFSYHKILLKYNLQSIVNDGFFIWPAAGGKFLGCTTFCNNFPSYLIEIQTENNLNRFKNTNNFAYIYPCIFTDF